jgi:hypothetical protein
MYGVPGTPKRQISKMASGPTKKAYEWPVANRSSALRSSCRPARNFSRQTRRLTARWTGMAARIFATRARRSTTSSTPSRFVTSCLRHQSSKSSTLPRHLPAPAAYPASAPASAPRSHASRGNALPGRFASHRAKPLATQYVMAMQGREASKTCVTTQSIVTRLPMGSTVVYA